MVTPKENYLNVLMHKDPVWTPVNSHDCKSTGFSTFWIEKGPAGGGLDGFGVNWVDHGGGPLPEPGRFLFEADDLPDWRDFVSFPDLNAFDWESYAQQQLNPGGNPIDRTQYAVNFGIGNGPYERIASFMGFEETLVALAMYPDEVRELVDALVDWKIEQVRLAKKWIDPDTITNYDDFCTQKSPFMSPDMYREIFLAPNKRFYDAIWDMGMIPVQHTCGYGTPLVEMFIESGIAAWTSVQPCNDISDLLDKYGDKLTFIGGFDTVGTPALPDATDEEIEADVKRCFNEYGGRKGYIFHGFRMVDSPEKRRSEMERVLRPALKYFRGQVDAA